MCQSCSTPPFCSTSPTPRFTGTHPGAGPVARRFVGSDEPPPPARPIFCSGQLQNHHRRSSMLIHVAQHGLQRRAGSGIHLHVCQPARNACQPCTQFVLRPRVQSAWDRREPVPTVVVESVLQKRVQRSKIIPYLVFCVIVSRETVKD